MVRLSLFGLSVSFPFPVHCRVEAGSSGCKCRVPPAIGLGGGPSNNSTATAAANKEAVQQPPKIFPPKQCAKSRKELLEEGVFLRSEESGALQRQNPITNDKTQLCIAMTKQGPCMHKAHSETVPYCDKHLKEGDPALMMVKHERFGVTLTAARDLPKGYLAALFGDLVATEKMKDKNQEYGFQGSSGKYHVMPRTYERSYLQFAQCPGPNEKGVWTFAEKHHDLIKPKKDKMGSLMYKLKRNVPKNYQLPMLYGEHEYEAEQFFLERGTVRCDVWQKNNPTQLKDGVAIADLQLTPELAKKKRGKIKKGVAQDRFTEQVGGQGG